MIRKMNYLLLSSIMVAVIDNSYGRCCPCEKKKVEKADEKEKIFNTKEITVEPQSTETHNDLEKNLIINVDNLNPGQTEDVTFTKKKKKKKKKNNNKHIGIKDIVSDANVLTSDEETKVIDLLGLLLENNVICNECVKNTAAENKIILVYEASKKEGGNGYEFKSTSLKFGYCEQHESNAKCPISDCGNNAYYITWCGHKICKQHLNDKETAKWYFVVCKECNVVCCNADFIDHFGTHLWCNSVEERHYFCYKNKDSENPYKQNDKSYNRSSWLCPKHNLL